MNKECSNLSNAIENKDWEIKEKMKLGEESKENVPHKKCRVIAKKYEEENNKLSKKIDKLRVEIG